MGFYAKKTLVGGYREVEEDEAEYYIQDIGEYHASKREISDLKKELRETERAAAAKQHRQQTEYEKKLTQIKDKANQMVLDEQKASAGVKRDLDKAMKTISALEGMNANLKRIARERANQMREITPKKEHDGYLVLRSEEWKEKWVEPVSEGSKKVVHKEADVWKSVIQTPVDASIPLEEAEDSMISSIRSVLDEMGCRWFVKSKSGMGYDESWKASGEYTNVLYRWKFRADYKAGLWEADVYTTSSLVVPEYRRPPVRKQK